MIAPTYVGNYLVHKAAHIFWYALLCSSFYFATGNVFLSITLTTLYGISDEIHQSFVPTRTGRWNDAAIDFAAAGFVGLVIYYLEKYNLIKINSSPEE